MRLTVSTLLGKIHGEALQGWLQQRDSQKQYLFYGRGSNPMSYNNARVLFKKYLKRAGLESGQDCPVGIGVTTTSGGTSPPS